MSGHCPEPEVLGEMFSQLPVSRTIAKVQVGSAYYKQNLNKVPKVKNTKEKREKTQVTFESFMIH